MSFFFLEKTKAEFKATHPPPFLIFWFCVSKELGTRHAISMSVEAAIAHQAFVGLFMLRRCRGASHGGG